MSDRLFDELQRLYTSNSKRFNGPIMESYDVYNELDTDRDIGPTLGKLNKSDIKGLQGTSDDKDSFVVVDDQDEIQSDQEDPRTLPTELKVGKLNKNGETEYSTLLVPREDHPDVLFGNNKYKEAYKTQVYLPGLAAKAVKDNDGNIVYDKKSGRPLYEPIVMGKENKKLYLIHFYVEDNPEAENTRINKTIKYKKSGRAYVLADAVMWDDAGEPYIPYNKVNYATRQKLKRQPKVLVKNITPNAQGQRPDVDKKLSINPNVQEPDGSMKKGLDNTLGRALRRGVSAGATEFEGQPVTTFNKTGAVQEYPKDIHTGRDDKKLARKSNMPDPKDKVAWAAHIAKIKALKNPPSE